MQTARDHPATLSALLGAGRSGAPALVYGGATWSYARLDDLGRRVARGLAELGVAAGDRVALWLPNVPAWLALALACARLGAVAVAVNTRFRSAELEDIVGRAGCKVLALWPGFKGIDFPGILRDADPAALDTLETLVVYDEGSEAAPADLPGRRVARYRDLEARAPLDADLSAPDAGCVAFTTSGTTRAPKLVLHGQSAVAGHALAVAARFGYAEPGTTLLGALPLCGVFGFCQQMAALAAGRPTVLMPLFDPEAAVRLVRDHGVTHLNGSDGMIDRLLAAAGGARPFPTLRACGFAGFDPALADIVERAERRGVRLHGLYGMSEVQALFARQPDDADIGRRALAGGVPVSPEARVRVRDPEGGRLLPHGERGEIEIRGPSLFAGYLGDPGATREAFTEDGFFRTGDLGYTTPDGGFVFLSRMGDALRLGGFLVSPDEIEGHLLRHPAVGGCQVVGVAGRRGPRAVAFVTLAPGGRFDEEALRAFCRGALAAFKVPERIFVLDALPATTSANGTKVQRGRLREMAQAWTGDPDGAGDR